MTDRELVTLTAALLAARHGRWDLERAAAEALRLWYFVGGELGPRVMQQRARQPGGPMNRRQALYRVEWDDDGTQARPPASVVIGTAGPWGGAESGDLLYEGPLGRTTVTVEYREPEQGAV